MLAEQMGCELARVIIVEDTAEALLEAIPNPESADLVITVGGTGFGRKDIIEETLNLLEAEIIFEGVKIRPSHSFIFSMKGKQVIFSLPGRIGATEIGFELLAKLGIWKMQGRQVEEQVLIPVQILKEVDSSGDQIHVLRGKLNKKDGEIWVEPLRRKSWHRELIEADGLIIIEEKRAIVKPGDWVNFMVYKNRLAGLVKQKFI